jgi:hypothetical protein
MALNTQITGFLGRNAMYLSRSVPMFLSNYLVKPSDVKVAGFPPRRPGLDLRSGHVGFVVDKVALGQVFSEYFGFPCQSSFH